MSNHQKSDTREPEQPEQAAQRASGADGLHAHPDDIPARVMSPVNEDKPVQLTVTPLPYRSILALCLGRVADKKVHDHPTLHQRDGARHGRGRGGCGQVECCCRECPWRIGDFGHTGKMPSSG